MEEIKNKIEQALKLAKEQLEPHRKEKEEALKKYEAVEKEIGRPVDCLIEEFLDYQLKDFTGTSIKINDVIIRSKNFLAYKVIDRGMQCVFGQLMYNSRIEVLRVDSNFEVIGKKTKQIFPSELKEYTVVTKTN